MTRVVVYLPDGEPGPGRLGETELELAATGPGELILPEAIVRDERHRFPFHDHLFADRGLVFDPAAGGGPLADPRLDRQAHAFGVTNVAFHVQRALRLAVQLLGHSLPRLLVRVGMHGSPRRWGGGHYRLPAPSYAEHLETGPLRAEGEVHLGSGRRYLSSHEGRYFHAPAHNAAIVYHEVGHHVCRHTADFRLNRLRPPERQSNRRTALEEGTADFFAAVLLGTPDIYGWHRQHVPVGQLERRQLGPEWTMAHFRGGPGQDPHADGTVWASALWSARNRMRVGGADPIRFDAMLLRGLSRFGRDGEVAKTEEGLRRRRHFSRLLAAIIEVDCELAPAVLAAMSNHGIHLGGSNSELCDAARTRLVRRLGA